jgi:hypothetical protein
MKESIVVAEATDGTTTKTADAIKAANVRRFAGDILASAINALNRYMMLRLNSVLIALRSTKQNPYRTRFDRFFVA